MTHPEPGRGQLPSTVTRPLKPGLEVNGTRRPKEAHGRLPGQKEDSSMLQHLLESRYLSYRRTGGDPTDEEPGDVHVQREGQVVGEDVGEEEGEDPVDALSRRRCCVDRGSHAAESKECRSGQALMLA